MRKKITVSEDGYREEPVANNAAPAETQASTELPEESIEPEIAAPAETPTAAEEETVPQIVLSQEKYEAIIQELEDAKKQAATEHDQYLRTLAEFQNFRRRSAEERKENIQSANRELILNILPILDNLERALAASEVMKNSAETGDEKVGQKFESLHTGVMLTLRQMQEVLRQMGVTPIEAVGAEFDPAMHEAVFHVETTDQPDQTVMEELERGYMIHSRVLRPSKVKVSKGTS